MRVRVQHRDRRFVFADPMKVLKIRPPGRYGFWNLGKGEHMGRYGETGPDEVWHEGPAATARLRALGLDEPDLTQPLELARVDALGCTELDAPGAPGYVFWTRTNRYLREKLELRAWTWTNRDNILRTINPDKKFAITAISGTGNVGARGGEVQTRNPKGSAVAELIRYNLSMYGGPRQSALPGMELPADEFEPDMVPTWFLLYKPAEDGITCELSLPVDMMGNVVNRWAEHILLGVIRPDGGGGTGLPLDIFNGPDQGPDVTVERIA